jgi:hypothetical protein
MKRKESLFSVSVFGLNTQVISNTKQAAVRAAIRYLLSHKLIAKTPITDNDWPSSWRGVSVEYKGRA